MAGSLDDNPPKLVFAGDEYQYALLGKGKIGEAHILYSRRMTMTREQIAAELRALADWVEFGIRR